MKPRIRRERGIWVCRSVLTTVPMRIVVGDGYTVRAAYAEWQAQLRSVLLGV
jgi:hypothetical protein